MLGTVLSRRGSTSRAETLWNDGIVARVRSWPLDRSTAFLTLQGAHDADAFMPDDHVISSWLAHMRDRGYTHVRTSALSTAALRALEPHGFAVCQRLALLTSTLDPTRESMSRPVDFSNTFDNDFSLQSTSLTRLRMRRADLGRVLDVDESAFGRRWSLDEPGLCDAVSATPRARVFVARSRAIDGYVVVGATNSAHPSNGFVQRLAVHASAQRNGLGKALLRSALQWLTTRGCKTVYVNTEQTNEVALSLYQQHGFRAVPHELCVLECNLNERKA